MMVKANKKKTASASEELMYQVTQDPREASMRGEEETKSGREKG
jgi:hypothetical protein